MSRNNKIEIVNPNNERVLVASLNFKDLPNGKTVSWKKSVYSKEEVSKIPSRTLFAMVDDGENLQEGTKVSHTYKFSEKEKDKYVKIYAYIEGFKEQPQAVVFYVEEELATDIRIRKVELVQNSDNSEEEKVYVGELLKLKTIYSKEDKSISSNIKKNVKWMVKIDGEEERLIVDGEVIRGGEVEFIAPLDWKFKNVIFMPYLYKHTEDISCQFQFLYRCIEECYWTNENKERIESLGENIKKAYFYIKTDGYECDEAISIKVSDEDGSDILPGQKEVVIEGRVNCDGEIWVEAYNIKE